MFRHVGKVEACIFARLQGGERKLEIHPQVSNWPMLEVVEVRFVVLLWISAILFERPLSVVDLPTWWVTCTAIYIYIHEVIYQQVTTGQVKRDAYLIGIWHMNSRKQCYVLQLAFLVWWECTKKCFPESQSWLLLLTIVLLRLYLTYTTVCICTWSYPMSDGGAYHLQLCILQLPNLVTFCLDI